MKFLRQHWGLLLIGFVAIYVVGNKLIAQKQVAQNSGYRGVGL